MWASFSWTLLRLVLTLLNNKTKQNLEKQEAAERAWKKEQEKRNGEEEGCWKKIKNAVNDALAFATRKTKYVLIPLILALPTVIFRLGSFWLVFTYCLEWFLSKEVDGPGIGIFIPFILLGIVFGINYLIATKKLDLNQREAVANSIAAIMIPSYVPLDHLVR